MERVLPKTMPGVLELLPLEQCAFERFLATIRRGYERFGFLPIETPAIELRDVLLTKTGGDTEKQVYFVQSTGALAQGEEAKLALRFDLTVPLARYVAEHEQHLAFPFRRYQIQRVYRGESAQRGRFREFYQCDVDIVGRDELALANDAELPVVIDHVFGELGVGEFAIDVSNRKILRGLLRAHGIEGERAAAALREVDKLDKRPKDAIVKALAGLGIEGAPLAALMTAITLRGARGETIAALRDLRIDDAGFATGVDELDRVLGIIADFGVPESRCRANLAIARGLDYYTGTVYETRLTAHPEVGSVCSGGRYDDLASLYTKSKLPGVGISIGATRLFDQLRTAGLVAAATESTTAVLVTVLDQALADRCRALAHELRKAGVNTELHSEGWKLGKQLKYAQKAGIRNAVILGPDELARGIAMVRDLALGAQREVPLGDLARVLAAPTAP